MPTTNAPRRKSYGLRAHLVALVASALLPALAVGAIAVQSALSSYRQAYDDRLEGTARALASAINTEIGSYVVALSTLATARGFDEGGDLSSVHQQAQEVAATLATRIFVVGPELSLLLHTHFPTGTRFPPEPRSDSLNTVRRVFDTGRPAISSLLLGQVSGRLVAPIYVPVIRHGKVIYAIGVALEAGRISRMLAEQSFRKGGYASLVDGFGQIVARSSEAEQFTGKMVREWVIDGVRTSESGMLRGPNRSDTEIITAFHRVASAPGWIVTMAEPVSTYYASLWRPLSTLVVGGLGTLTIALVVAVGLGRRVLGPVEWLTRTAERVVTSGESSEGFTAGPRVGVSEFERLRTAVLQAHGTLQEKRWAVVAGEARLQAVVDTAVDAIVVIDESRTMQSFNRAAETIFGYTVAEVIGHNVSMLMDAEHGKQHDGHIAEYVRTGKRKVIGIGREVEGRRKDGTLVPLDLAMAEWRDPGGQRFFTGIMRDISSRKADDARRSLLMREVDHRGKNALAVVQAVLRLTPRDKPEVFAAAIEARVGALARVHSLLADEGWVGADLRTVVERELAPYAPPRPGQDTAVTLDGPPVALTAAAVQPLAMVLHELATNAAKHGALSIPGGRIEVYWRTGRRAGEDGMLRLRWTESGGPPVLSPPTGRGFGTRVVEATVRGQLGGATERRWEKAGLVCEVVIPLARAVAGAEVGTEPVVPIAA